MEEGSCSGNIKSSDQKQGKREEEDVWSDLHALKRLYDFLQQSVNVAADRVAPQESIEKLDQKSTLLLKKLLDDATQQAVKSKFLFNPSAITNPGVKPTEPPTEPPVVVMKPENQVVAEDFKHFHECPNQVNPLLPQTTSHIKSNIAGSESGKETPMGWDSIEPLAKKEPSEKQSSRGQPHQKPNDLSFVKQKDNKLVGRQFPSPSKMVRQRASAMSSNRIFLSGESIPVTPLKLELHQPEKKKQTEKERDVKNCTKPKLLDSKSSVVVPKLEKDSDGLKRETRESMELKKKSQNRKSTIQIESGTKKRSVNMNLKRRPKDQSSRTIQRSRVDPKQRDRNRNSTVSLKRNPAVKRIPRVVKQQTRSSTTSSCSRSSSCSSSSSPSIISNGVRRSNQTSRIHDRSRVVMHPQSKLQSFGSSRRSTTHLTSLPKQSNNFLTSREQNNGCRKNTKKEGKLRRIKNKLSVILHHHHHHYHHEDEDNNNNRSCTGGHEHRSFWKYIRGKKKDDGRRPNSKSKEVEIYAEKAVVRDTNQNQHQHGYLHMLLDGLIRHLWHTRGQRRKKQKMNFTDRKLKVKQLHWWQKWKKMGGVKLKGRKKKPLLKLGHGGRKSVSTKKR